MKHLIKLLTVAAVALFAVTAKAQTYGSQSVSITTVGDSGAFPTLLTSGGTSNVNAVIDVRKAENVAFQYKHSNSGNSNVAITITFDWSVDGVTFAAGPLTTWSVNEINAAATPTTYATNFATLGYGYMRVKTIALAGSGTTITNQDFQYSLKLLTKP